MTNLPQYRCAHCGIVHMVCQDISPKAHEQKCGKCGLIYHAFDLRSGPVYCITQKEREGIIE